MTKLSDIPPKARRVQGMCVGFFFGDTTPMELPGDAWLDAKETARFVSGQSSRFVAFQRYYIDPDAIDGRSPIDPGWVYFRGRPFTRDDVLSGNAERDCSTFVPTETLKANVKDNGFGIVWFEEPDRAYPFRAKDVFIKLDE